MGKAFTEQFEKEVIEENVGLPIDLIRKLDNVHMSFYCQNREHMKIERNNNGEVLYILRGLGLVTQYYFNRDEKPGLTGVMGIVFRRVVLNEKEFDDYLDRINFVGPKIESVPLHRYVSREKINEEIDKICKKS